MKLVDMLVLETNALPRASSSLALGTIKFHLRQACESEENLHRALARCKPSQNPNIFIFLIRTWRTN